MKTFNDRSCNALIWIATCLLLSKYAANQAMSAETRSSRTAFTESASVQSVIGGSPLIIHRAPNLGRNVVVDLSIDGAAVAAIAYGHTYKGVLPPGRHVISVAATPNAKWKTPSEMTLDVQQGQTYNFTAIDDGSGHVILEGGQDSSTSH